MKKQILAFSLIAMIGSGLVAAEAVAAPICTDRPTKANATCTVPAGRFQLESGAAGWSRIEGGGAKTDVWLVGSSFLKFGLTDRSDLQVAFTPYVDIRTKLGDASSHTSGIGDVAVRYKHRLTAADASVQVGLIPFVKLPTAKRGIGNSEVEGGVAVPISIATGGPVTVVLGPEVNLLADADGSGRHVAVVNLVNVAAPVAPGVTLIGELWSNMNFDPSGTIKQASADVAVAYALSENVQLDAGANAGLTRDTADIEVYAGISTRF